MDTKNVLVYVDDVPKFKMTLLKNTTIKDIKDYFKKLYPLHTIRMFINNKTELNVFDTAVYDNNSLDSVWVKIESPVLLLNQKIDQKQVKPIIKTPANDIKTPTNPPVKTPIKNKTLIKNKSPTKNEIGGGDYNKLPPDMKKYLSTFVEPLQAIELCRNLNCDWVQLLNINYDFVTQGFAPPEMNPKEKFEYLATRVSKNKGLKEGELPEKIFVHYDGIPLGTESFYNQILDDYNEYALYDRRDHIIKTLTAIPGVEARQDTRNLWITVKPGTNLPDRIKIDRHLLIADLYDYPSKRANTIYEFYGKEIDYPGENNNSPEVINSMTNKLTELIEMNVDEDVENGREVEKTLINLGIYNSIPEYRVYGLMREGFTRSEAEAFRRRFF